MTLPIQFAEAGVPASLDKLAESLGQASAKSDGGLNGRELLKLDKKDGYWAFGTDGIELEENALVAVNPVSFQHGYISWAAKGGEILGEAMTPVTQPPPNRAELPNTGERWDEQLSFDAQIVNGEDQGVMLVYKTTAHGGKQFIRDIMRRVVGKMHEGPEYIVPALSLGSSSYIHKSWGLVYKPSYFVSFWLSMQGEQEGKKLNESAPSAAEQTGVEDPPIKEETVETPPEKAEATAQASTGRRTRQSAATEQQAPAADAAPARRRRSAANSAPAEQPAEAPPPRRRRRA